MNNRFKATIYCAIGMVIIVLALSMACRFAESKAEALLATLMRIEFGRPSDADVKQLKATYKKFLVLDDVSGPESATQHVLFTFTNRPLSLIHLAPPRRVNIGITLRNGKLASKFVQFREDDRCALAVEDADSIPAVEQASGSQSGVRQFSLSRDKSSRIKGVVIQDTPSTPISQVAADWNVNLSRLASWGSKSDGSELYPSLYCGK